MYLFVLIELMWKIESIFGDLLELQVKDLFE